MFIARAAFLPFPCKMRFVIRSRRTTICLVVLLVGVAASFSDYYRVARYTCMECRATLTDQHIFGLHLPWISHTADSRALLARYPGHEHHWCYGGSRQSYSLTAVCLACGRAHPIWRLPIDVQARYARLVPPAELQQTLQDLDTAADRPTAAAITERIYKRVEGAR